MPSSSSHTLHSAWTHIHTQSQIPLLKLWSTLCQWQMVRVSGLERHICNRRKIVLVFLVLLVSTMFIVMYTNWRNYTQLATIVWSGGNNSISSLYLKFGVIISITYYPDSSTATRWQREFHRTNTSAQEGWWQHLSQSSLIWTAFIDISQQKTAGDGLGRCQRRLSSWQSHTDHLY